jgi:hypothetical protein
MDDRERLKIVIMQILEHNNVHIEKYAKWANFANDSNLGDIGSLLNEAKKQVETTQAVLQKTLSLVT